MQKKKVKRLENADEFKHIKDNPYFSNWSKEELNKLFYSDIYEIFLLMLDGKIIGFILLMVVIDSAEIIYIYVNEENRSNGLGSFLLKKLKGYLKNIGVTEIFLEVAKNNNSALNLYQKTGFVQQGIRKNYYKNNIDALTFKLSL